MRERKVSYVGGQIIFAVLAVFLIAGGAWAQDHDLVFEPAPDVTSGDPADWKSPDLKIGADFGVGFPADIVRRGAANPIYARFYINGVLDFEIASGDIQIQFHYRNAAIGETPPALSDPSWQHIGDLSVIYSGSDPPLFMTLTWPDDFPSVTGPAKFVEWTAPAAGDYFHVRAELVYPSGYVDENPDDNVAISLYESILGVRSVDVVLVHDASGSMGYYTHEGDTYMLHAQSRAGAFVYGEVNLDDPGVDTYDRLAVVAFSSQYFPDNYSDIWPVPPPPAALTPVTSTDLVPVVAAIGGMSASGNTPLGVGLQRAIDIFAAEGPTPDPDRKRAIALLSDGYENAGTPRACPPSYPTGTCVGGSILTQLQDNNIRVYTFALGTSAWTECLECLAEQTGGQWSSVPDPGTGLGEAYLHMQQAYTDDDLYRIDRGVTGGGDDTYETYFEAVDDVLYFILHWDVLSARLNMELRPPGDSLLRPEALPNASVHRGDGYVVVRVEKPAQGNWVYGVTGERGENYLVAVRSDIAGVRLEMDVRSAGLVGGPIKIKAQLTDRGKPIKVDRLIAAIQVPVDASLDTKLRDAARDHILKYGTMPVDRLVLKKNPDISLRAALVHKITDGQPEILVKKRSVRVPLKHDGDGFYSGVLEEYTDVAGDYKVTVKCSEKKFDRIQSRQIRLRPGKLDPGRSFSEILQAKTIDGRSVWMLRTYPADKFGNAITAPSLVGQMRARVEGAELVKKPEIIYDGAFQQQLKVLPRQKPKLEMMRIGRQEIRIQKQGPSQFK